MSATDDRPNTRAAFVVADALRQMGATRIFGVPGGGSSLDLIAGAKAVGLPFVLARQETAGVIMAAATAELTGRPGAVLVTKGPGLGNAANGMAHAHLDRAQVVLVADAFADGELEYVTHQVFDQIAMLAPVTRGQVRIAGGEAGAAMAGLAAAAMTAPWGPVVLEMSDVAARAPAGMGAMPPLPCPAAPDARAVAEAARLLARARRPVVVVGLEARGEADCAAVRRLVAALGCPALVTYKAKGVVADADPCFAGVFTGGAAEAALLHEADLIVLVGADPVEFIPQRWRYAAPVLECGLFARQTAYVTPEVSVIGDLAAGLAGLDARASDWSAAEIGAHRDAMRAALALPGRDGGIGPQEVVALAELACRLAGVDARATVDAGAHMIAATTFWPCARPGDLLISNGLSTMGFALPAAIAAALHEPDRPAIAFTGDGGLAMCLGELATAVACQARVVVVVFNDSGLSLIDIKRGGRDLPEDSLHWPRTDFADVMTALGGLGIAVRTHAEYAAALVRGLAADGPVVIDVVVEAQGYAAQLQALRG